VLGGTGEARTLAARWHVRPGIEVISSLAGRVRTPVLPDGAVRVGGFGDVDGLVRYLAGRRIEAVVDATHPFADRITATASAACTRTGLPLVVLRRPGWSPQPGDDWLRVASIDAAAAAVRARPPGAVLLTTGRSGLAAFAPDAVHHYVARTVDPPAGALPARLTSVLDRGPYTVPGELRLLREFAITVLVSKDSGGELTCAKLAAARELGLPVVLVDRSAPPAGVRLVPTVAQADLWLAALADGAHRSTGA